MELVAARDSRGAVLILTAARAGSMEHRRRQRIATSMMLLYLASTLYHAILTIAQACFRLLDHGAISFGCGHLHAVHAGSDARTVGLDFVWTRLSLAVFGLTMKASSARSIAVTVPLYLLMGWLAVNAAPHILFTMPWAALFG